MLYTKSLYSQMKNRVMLKIIRIFLNSLFHHLNYAEYCPIQKILLQRIFIEIFEIIPEIAVII